MGSEAYPGIRGEVLFYETRYGVFVIADMSGLPENSGQCADGILGFHIHGGERCSGDIDTPFSAAGEHYNPGNCPHPYHAGDLPPLFAAGGRAFSAFLTNRFSVDEIIGKTVIVHGSADDFTTQPGGNAGQRIACGVIRGNL
ncbi:MAG: superoxide dismutase family protein [Ruminococcaceae bacterium]|nr:superoxide dismutase family protein [Oscillospiraceae bacterium]